MSKPLPAYQQAAEELRNNPGQWSFYESAGNCVALAGPGSGKTKTLTIKIAQLLDGTILPPSRIACITYSNECAREIERRLSQLAVQVPQRAFVGTVHSFCFQHLVKPLGGLSTLALPSSLTVASWKDQDFAFQKALDATLPYSASPSDYRSKFERYRRLHFDRNSQSWKDGDPEIAAVIDHYENSLRDQGLIDFDGMVLTALQMVRNEPWARDVVRAKFPVIVGDEYQDLGAPLDDLIRQLMSHGVRVLAVGDPDQSIYGFVGAVPHRLRDLSNAEGVQAVELKKNYRSRKRIVQGSEAVLGESRAYEAVDEQEGIIEFIYCPEGLEQQAETIIRDVLPKAMQGGARPVGELAVLYADKNVGDAIAAAADTAGVNYTRVDQGAPYPKTPVTRFIEDCAAWCSGGWETGEVQLGSLVRRWLALRGAVNTEAGRTETISLVHFLWDHRGSDQPAHGWLNSFIEQVLDRDGAHRGS